MFNNVKAAISHYLGRNPLLVNALDKHGTDGIGITSLPSEYDNTPFETYINGKAVHTVGEYKAEVSKGTWDSI